MEDGNIPYENVNEDERIKNNCMLFLIICMCDCNLSNTKEFHITFPKASDSLFFLVCIEFFCQQMAAHSYLNVSLLLNSLKFPMFCKNLKLFFAEDCP